MRKKTLLHNSRKNMQLYGCECGGWEEAVVGSGVVLQSGTLAVWNAGRGQSRWELSAAVLETVSKLSVTLLPPPPPPSLTSLLSSLSLCRLQAQKRGAILRDQNEAGTDNLV